MEIQERYVQASIQTANDLRTIARSVRVRDLSQLSLPEIDAAVDVVSRVIPAGNVPGVILNGLARLSGRRPPLETVKRDVGLLFKGVEQVLDKAVYGAFFAGPAAIIWGYQNLLKLAGKEPEDAFPEGVWQFYVEYALREDTARHTNETFGFDALLKRHRIRLSAVDRIAAWVMASVHCLHQYDDLMENEWYERTCTRLLCEVTQKEPDAARYARLYRGWQRQRPYGRGSDAGPNETYCAYRRLKFDRFLGDAMQDLSGDLRHEWTRRVRLAQERDLGAYLRQMSILAYLEPGTYGETRVPIPLERAHVGLIHRGRYYVIPACSPGTVRPTDVHAVRAQVAAVMARPPDAPPLQLSALAQIKRVAWDRLRGQMDRTVLKELDALRYAPILLNADRRPRHFPLAELRQAERGVGDHALTLFDTGETIVFDQSHIFFDGTWGAALAEIVTNEALSWAVYLDSLPLAQPGESLPRVLGCTLSLSERERVGQASRVASEASAETDIANLKAILALRKLFKQRSDLLRLTVNDLLVLYRAIHAVTYRPPPGLVSELKDLARNGATRRAATVALEALDRAKQVNPAILIPVDASWRSPRDRLYPMTFEVPLGDLDLLFLHDQTACALKTYREASGDRTSLYAAFDRLQRTYLATLAGLGEVFSKAKEIALRGESASMGTIKMLAHMPAPLQRMLDEVPGRFDVLNDIIKGREVFSNVGAVAPSSTLTRFITAKDDNDQKTMAWGAITDANGVMRITLRDFRPHVGMLDACECKEWAIHIAQDYLDAYARGLNDYIRDLLRITRTSRETHIQRPGGGQ
jgi:hypothetical protein